MPSIETERRPAAWWMWAIALAATVVLVAGAFAARATPGWGYSALTAAAAVCLLVALAWQFAAWHRATAEAAARESRFAGLAALLDAAPDAHWAWDFRDGRERSSTAATRLGLEAAGGGFESFVRGLADDDRMRLEVSLAALRAGGEAFTMTIADRGGGRVFEANARPFGNAGAPAGTVVWLRDVSAATATLAAVRAARQHLDEVLDAVP